MFEAPSAQHCGPALAPVAPEAAAPAGRKVYLHADAFALMQQVQRNQSGSPRFDLRDLTSAAIKALLRQPNAVSLIEQQARNDFAARLRGSAAL